VFVSFAIKYSKQYKKIDFLDNIAIYKKKWGVDAQI